MILFNIKQTWKVFTVSIVYDILLLELKEKLDLEEVMNFNQPSNEKRKFSILKREKAMDDIQKAKNRSAIMAGICILGATVAVCFNGQDLHEVLQHELSALYSWESLGQYFRDLGPLTTVLSVGAGGFITKYFKNSMKLKQAQNEFINFNNSLENEQTLGGKGYAK